MHKRLLNEATIELVIEPDGPILIKSGAEGADPTRPDMEFVRTWRNGAHTIYLPGSSLKGMLRAHCERIVRSIADDRAACNPVDTRSGCGHKKFKSTKRPDGIEAYSQSCFICQIFGNTVLAARLRTADAYPDDPKQVRTEQRDGVAIDRVFGAVAVGPFQMEVATSGQFRTKLQLQNFTLAQLGLVALALRDLSLGRVAIGFGKSRGLGRVKVSFEQMSIRFPACEIQGEDLVVLGGEHIGKIYQLPGVGRFPGVEEGYNFPNSDTELANLPADMRVAINEWLEPQITAKAQAVEAVWRTCIPAWREVMEL